MPSLNMMREVGANDFPTKTLDRALQERAADPKPSPEQIKAMEKCEAKQREIEDFEKIAREVVPKASTLPPPWAKTREQVQKVIDAHNAGYAKLTEREVESLEDHIVANYAHRNGWERARARVMLAQIAGCFGRTIEEHFGTSEWGEGSIASYKPQLQCTVSGRMVLKTRPSQRIEGLKADMIVCDDLEEARRDAAAFLRALDN